MIATIITAAVVGDDASENGADVFKANDAMQYIAFLTVGLMVARGLAKAGNREPSWPNHRLTSSSAQPPTETKGLTRPLKGMPFYGLYTSWCYLSQNTPKPQHVFWEAMGQRISPGNRLRMKGPAATDYILTSYRAVV